MTERLTVLRPTPGFESEEASMVHQQLEDVSRRLWNDVRELDAEALGWQLAPGVNTIGMLLAHIAIAEVYWVSVVTQTAFLCQQVLGIGPDDDGMPLPADAAPPANLNGRSLAYYQDLLMKSRDHTRKALERMSAEDLDREFEVRGRTQSYTANARWGLAHIVQHEVGHYGQINLLRHLHRAAHPVRPSAS